MWKAAIEDALVKIKDNTKRFGDHFPHVSFNGKYGLNPNEDWTNGFWSGMLWLGYEYSGDEAYREAARRTVQSFKRRMESHRVLDHHDIGFLYTLSSQAQWMVERDEEARELTLQAADVLMRRWRPNGQYLQAWGLPEDTQHGGRMIIDCLMNLPLLFWASQQTGDERYREAAIKQADQSRRYLVRGDDSSYHTFVFDVETGEAMGGATHQGYTNGSTWSRGQAWGVYGFALAYRYTGNPLYLDTAKRMATYFIRHLPEDHVAYWDFDVPIDTNTYRDSSASAIFAAGMVELISHLDAVDPDRAEFEKKLRLTLESLVCHYSTIGEQDAEGLLKHGAYYVRGNTAPDDFMIWGDYFYLEVLMRMARGIKGYWYE
ncbi:glucuronyl hydrolase [Paenibacillus glucanolyticus]|jgi:unsaturated chondroitin disaccharide hydrolase|uniref:glycoside hydrolase family 88 protein n=1 Tax=Paenibacillus TaxID=44249 RepID=UPI0003E26B85|nr:MULTISPECIES: glycoside hydrolase family 88 protein [Paenibacillus]ANA78825.1 glucuronyl hydrolase [Paenibacillus glucanolyticus]AVV57260.1 glucuronyl hydrolase [Paenibacillus glucanolyticus]ETT32528.1 glycoside hydrolase family protein [Paenibacillus sp. FSL R5-808]